MNEPTVWWLLAGAAVVVELLTGTFYLLMLAFGLVAGALAALAGVPPAGQFLCAALVGGGAVAGWHLRRLRQPPSPAAGANRDVNLDVGETVQVERWNDDGTTSVRHRGANWTAVRPAGAAPDTGAHRVREIVGSHLVLEKI